VRAHRYTMSKQSGSEWLRYHCACTHLPHSRVHRYTMSNQCGVRCGPTARYFNPEASKKDLGEKVQVDPIKTQVETAWI